MEYITVGIIGKAHGIKGEVIVHPMTYDANRFFELDRVFTVSKIVKELTIERVSEFKNGLKIKFKESIDRNFAESIRNTEIQIPESEKIELPDDVFFIHDLIGCDVYDSQNNLIGQVTKIQESTAYDIYVVQTEKKEVLIPGISQFVKDVDIENKRINISEIPGLLDL